MKATATMTITAWSRRRRMKASIRRQACANDASRASLRVPRANTRACHATSTAMKKSHPTFIEWLFQVFSLSAGWWPASDQKRDGYRGRSRSSSYGSRRHVPCTASRAGERPDVRFGPFLLFTRASRCVQSRALRQVVHVAESELVGRAGRCRTATSVGVLRHEYSADQARHRPARSRRAGSPCALTSSAGQRRRVAVDAKLAPTAWRRRSPTKRRGSSRVSSQRVGQQPAQRPAGCTWCGRKPLPRSAGRWRSRSGHRRSASCRRPELATCARSSRRTVAYWTWP